MHIRETNLIGFRNVGFVNARFAGEIGARAGGGFAVIFAKITGAGQAVQPDVIRKRIPIPIIVNAVFARLIDQLINAFVDAAVVVVVNAIGIFQTDILRAFIAQAVAVVILAVPGDFADQHRCGNHRAADFPIIVIINPIRKTVAGVKNRQRARQMNFTLVD
ncbi:MAG: hypothetical protein ALAOOOJD_04435 [bacterium]|nr:hypothetical protein [bacterium]